METCDSAVLERTVTTGSTDIEPRTVRALVEKMTVLPKGGDLYTVTTESGSEYHVDTREDQCDCPDARHRGVICKHQRRVAFATGELPVPVSIDYEEIDPLLGEHTEGTPHILASDGGSLDVVENTDDSDTDDTEDERTYTYNWEPEHVGGARYVRCEECGVECIPADPESLLHREGCPERRD